MHAGLEKNNGGNLTIQDEDGNGSLEAVGGHHGAGIGGGIRSSGSDITITGGRVVESTAAPAPSLYQVTDPAGSPLPYTAARKDGVLTLTVTADEALLTGTLSGLQPLLDEGITQIVLTNGTLTASFSLADLLAKGTPTDTYTLTLQNTLTLNGAPVEL